MFFKLNTLLLIFGCFNVYAAVGYGSFDRDIKSVSTEVDKHIIVDDKGNSKQPSMVYPQTNNNSDAMSGTARIFSLFDQTGKDTEALSEKVEKQVNR